MNNKKIKIKTRNYAATEKIKAPLGRLVWYFLTFGKWGERNHYRHVSMREFIAPVSNRVRYAHQLIDGLAAHSRPKSINCRCSMQEVTREELYEHTNKKD